MNELRTAVGVCIHTAAINSCVILSHENININIGNGVKTLSVVVDHKLVAWRS